MTEAFESTQKTKKKAVIKIKREWCKSCDICIELCPKHVLERRGRYPEAVRPEDCTLCLECELHCPDFAISVEEEGNEQQ